MFFLLGGEEKVEFALVGTLVGGVFSASDMEFVTTTDFTLGSSAVSSCFHGMYALP